MLKNKTKIIAILAILILLFTNIVVFADNETNEYDIMPITTDDAPIDTAENSSSENLNVSSDNSIANADVNSEENYQKGDVYLTGGDITIDYIVDGNLFVCANSVTINSQIGGDAFIIANNLIIDEEGYIFSNLFTTCNNIEIKGVVYDVYAITQNLSISNGYIYRDLRTTCNTLTINGTVGRNAFVNCSSINFNTDGNNLGIIYGDLNYTSNQEISIPENVVNGNTNAKQSNNETTIQSTIASYILDLGSFLAFILIIWLICLFIAPKFLKSTNNYIGKKSLSILGFGILALIAIPVLCIILILLRLTSAISLLIFSLYVLSIIISKALFTIMVNNYVCSKLNINKNLATFGMLIITGIVIWALGLIPYVGAIISFITVILGLGLLVVSILPKKQNKENTENIKD